MAKIKIVHLTQRFHSADPAIRRGIEADGEHWGEFSVFHLIILSRITFETIASGFAGYIDDTCDGCGKPLIRTTKPLTDPAATYWQSQRGSCVCPECVVIDEQESAADLSTSGAP